jgi:hypothetical protein
MMVKKPFGCLTLPGLVTALLTALLVVVVGLVRGGVLFSPGPLNAQSGTALGGVTSHVELSSRCTACHAYFWQPATMADRCMACHVDIAAQRQDPSTLHGDQYKRKPDMTCRACHPDHLGPNHPLIDLSKADVSHEFFGYALTAHKLQTDGSPFTCNTCHVNGYSKFDQTVCTNCHQQIKADFMQSHLQAYGENCLVCHDGIDTYGHNFSHANVTFQLTGKHASLDCGACHTGARSIADLKATPQDCYSCHAKDDAHQGQFGTGCGACHTTSGWLPASFDHSVTKFPLTGAHLTLTCSQCHTTADFTNLSTDCYSCHAKDDAHQGQFGTGCGTCHTTTAWLPASFDHSVTKFPLTGAHLGLACTKCHANAVFTAIPTDCASCHAEPSFHTGLFAGMTCDQCHNTTAWSPATFNLSHPGGCGEGGCIDHERATCRDCHTVNLSTATCLKCHDTNNPGDGGGGG